MPWCVLVYCVIDFVYIVTKMADARFANVVRRVIKPSQVFMLGRSNIVLREQHRSTLTDDADKRYSLYPGHQSTTLLERTVLTVGSGVVALLDQRRGGYIINHSYIYCICYLYICRLIYIHI